MNEQVQATQEWNTPEVIELGVNATAGGRIPFTTETGFTGVFS